MDSAKFDFEHEKFSILYSLVKILLQEFNKFSKFECKNINSNIGWTLLSTSYILLLELGSFTMKNFTSILSVSRAYFVIKMKEERHLN